MQGLGNDFMVLENITQIVPLERELIQLWGDRHFGIGFDQLLLLQTSSHPLADYEYRIFNADGGEVGTCGNGLRCAARFVQRQFAPLQSQFSFATQKGLLSAEIDTTGEVNATLIVPKLQAGYSFKLPGQSKTYYAARVDVGNPHVILLANTDHAMPLAEIGRYLNQQHPDFPEGVNVSILTIHHPEAASLVVYERGVGETLGCGSAACAALVAANQFLLDPNTALLAQVATITLPGGKLLINWPTPTAPIHLKGNAVFVFDGEITI